MTKVLDIRSAVLTHPGRKRPHNEDFVSFFEPDSNEELAQSGRVYVVADGVGGAAKGERASQYATQKVLFDYYNDDDPDLSKRLVRAIRKAGNEIFDHAEQQYAFTQMEPTMVMAVVRGDELIVANVGDSRVYLIRGGEVHQITHDHTSAGELLRNGEITEEEARHIKGKHRITRSIGGHRDVRVDVFKDIHLRSGDRILLCTDGLTRYASRQNIAQFSKEKNPEDAVENAVQFANNSGGSDNISVALIAVGDAIDPDASAIRRGEAPVPIDWDTMDTQPPAYQVASKRRRWSTRMVLAIGAISLFLIAAIILIPIILIPLLNGNLQQDKAVDALDVANEAEKTSVPTALDISEKQTPTPVVTASPVPVDENTNSSEQPQNGLIEVPFDQDTFEQDWNIASCSGEGRLKPYIEENSLILIDGLGDPFCWINPELSERLTNYSLRIEAELFGCSDDASEDAFGIAYWVQDPGNARMIEFSCNGSYNLTEFQSNDHKPGAWTSLKLLDFRLHQHTFLITIENGEIKSFFVDKVEIHLEEKSEKGVVEEVSLEVGIYAYTKVSDPFKLRVLKFEYCIDCFVPTDP